MGAVLALACGPSGEDGAGTDGGRTTCTDGQVRCDGNSYQTCTDSEWVKTEDCTDACDINLGCVFCVPGSAQCDGETSRICAADGSGYTDEQFCDPVQGVSCDQNSGQCVGDCAPDQLSQGNLGCDFLPTVTAQLVSNSFPFAVAISNFGNQDAMLTIEGGALAAPINVMVTARSVHIQDLPWQPTLKKCNASGPFGCTANDPFVPDLVAGGSYRVRSTQPIAVYQFSPIDYTDGAGTFTYTNDASLVLPVHSLGTEYRVISYPFWPQFAYPGMMAVTASQDGTTVDVTTTAPVTGNGLDFQPGTPTQVTMQAGDVLQLLNLSGDLTGTLVASDRPVQVISGHYCTNVPVNIVACDHLEESMLPVEVLSTTYAVTAPALTSIPTGKERVIRIVATEDGTTLTYDPPLAGAATTLDAGQMAAVERVTGDYVITANKKIMVAQLMEGQDAGGGTGDPAITSAVPTDQYRTDYRFHAPVNYEANFVNITAPSGTTVTLDGTAVTGFTAIGSSGFSVARVQLDNTGDGNHEISAPEAFGITVYGYGQYTSFWYPGGLDLDEIVID